MSERARRRWPRRIAVAAGALVLLVSVVYAWALTAVDTSTTARAMVWRDADVGDQHRFPSRVIAAGDQGSPLPDGPEIDLAGAVPSGEEADFDSFLRRTETLAFVVVHRDRLVYERYFGGSDRATLQTSFSVAKSFLSTLVGIAIDEGLIGDIDDPITDYLPELAERDERFETDNPPRPAHDVLGAPVRGARHPGSLGRQRGHVLRRGPPGRRHQRIAGRGTARRYVALQQLQPAPPGDGPRTSHADVGLALHGHQVVAADRRGG